MVCVKGDMNICLRTQGDFSQRLRAIVSAVLWAEDLNLDLEIYWAITPGYIAYNFDKLFIKNSIPRLSHVHNGYLSKAHQVLSEDDMKIVVAMGDKIRIQSYSDFHPESTGSRGIAVLNKIRFHEHTIQVK